MSTIRPKTEAMPGLDADEIQPLSRVTVAAVLAEQITTESELFGLAIDLDDDEDACQRGEQRWPFPGAVELWLPGPHDSDRYVIGACHNMSKSGVGVRMDHAIEVGITIDIAIHQPTLSLHGRATVRHCSERSKGYLVGLAFEF